MQENKNNEIVFHDNQKHQQQFGATKAKIDIIIPCQVNNTTVVTTMNNSCCSDNSSNSNEELLNRKSIVIKNKRKWITILK